MAETAGNRLYKIRLALGDGLRAPEIIPDFVRRVQKATGVKYHDATISLLERMKQQWRLRDAEAFAAVDPLRRGAAWLAFGVTAGSASTQGVEELSDREAAAEAIRRKSTKPGQKSASTKRANDR